ncbi:MAG: hypothetical protein IIB56_12585, partial [Planctomycetes bacterium]|nr:hypothetical protein [Planctomycetota bacterium]
GEAYTRRPGITCFVIGKTGNSLTSRTAVVRTRMPGGVTGKAREGIPMSMLIIGKCPHSPIGVEDKFRGDDN